MSSNNTYTITEQQRSNFKPTYLYIKQHKITKLKYFGKTSSKDPKKYKGSGSYWKNHLKKHGNSIDTIWIKLFYNIDELVKVALLLSDILNVVESKTWANMRIEDGLAGGDTSNSENYKNSMINYHSNCDKTRYTTYGMKGKKQSEKFTSAIKEANNCPVMCEGVKYNSIKEAQLNYPKISIRKRLDNPKYPNFYRLKQKIKRK